MTNPVKPGRFAATCPECAGQYLVTIGISVEPLPLEKETLQRIESAPGVGSGMAQKTNVLDFKATSMTGMDLPATFGTIPSTLGGYRIVKELGRARMGSVYLARQRISGLSVALKTMRSDWSSDAEFVASFTREAYAAAQLVDHNLIQIRDFGQDRWTYFLCREFVDGSSLADLVADRRPIDAELAAGTILQAARGLKSAHDQGMIHRNIKPDNLLLDQRGIVKVAGLGMAKMPGNVGTAVGTPGFMAPEQVDDPLNVDARADIYSLGCTLSMLVTGQPPFRGRTALGVMTNHATEAIPPPESLNQGVPKALADILVKMVAKRPEDRFPHLGEVISALERFLGVMSAGVFAPKASSIESLEQAITAYDAVPSRKLRIQTIRGLVGLGGLCVLMGIVLHQPLLAIGFIGLGCSAVLTRFVINGIGGRSYLFTKVRVWIFGASLSEQLTWLAGLGLAATLIWVFGRTGVTLAFSLAGILLGVGLAIGLDRSVEAEQAKPLLIIEHLLRTLRLQGVHETAIRQFAKKYAGNQWQSLYERLFGYEALRNERTRGTLAGLPSKWPIDLRAVIIGWLDGPIQARQEQADYKHFQRIEERSFEAQGINLVVARRKARRVAESMVGTAAELRRISMNQVDGTQPRKTLSRTMIEATEHPEQVLVGRPKPVESAGVGWIVYALLNVLFGARTRLLAGLALLVACLVWMDQNGLASSQQLVDIATSLKETQDIAVLEDLKTIQVDLNPIRPTEPLKIAFLPKSILVLFNSYASGVAGLILLVSAFVRGWKMSLYAFPGAVIALGGPRLGWLFPEVTYLDPTKFSMIAGMGVAIVGLFLSRSKT